MTITADIIIHNSHILRPDGLGWREDVDALAVAKGKIVALGRDADMMAWRGPATETIDLAGGFLTPGLVDGHAHPIQGHDLQIGVDLAEVRDVTQLRAALAQEAASLRPGDWLQGHGLDPALLEGVGHPADLLEVVSGGRPVFLMFFDYHGAMVSRAALAKAGIAGPRSFASGAQILCDVDGLPTGTLLETEAVELIRSVLPRMDQATRLASMRRLFSSMAAAGLTGMHVMDANGDSLDCLAALEAQAPSPLRFHVLPWVNPGATRDELEAVLALQGRAGRLWRVCGAKFFIDGTIDAGTAWLHEPDLHGGCTGPHWPSPEAYSKAVHFFGKRGVQTVTHAIGDKAVRHVLETLASLPQPIRAAARHRVEHIETLPDEDIGQFAALDVLPSMQPSHAVRYASADQSDAWSQRLGPERAARGWRTADIAATGVRLVLGSDWPIAPYDPREILTCAVARRLPGHAASTAVGDAQVLSRAMALAGLTRHAAYAVEEETRLGALTLGFDADLTGFTVDPLRADVDELGMAPFGVTVCNGLVTHRRVN
ncbi:amidohydrolase [Acidocella aminolytica]|uniref:Amidohydrolase 3 n=1 Tax=Acidocella aminolytica 101 = DSM 11237 TaxID=1120923 RepID=A0A0D6PDA5_9PROT|nr:amidohydrolase [Acidocella aminolytica]GAN78854.1 amidohydrolase 3 [Acidocella aminolytica 101 = DSM 11237]GBQ33209.1 putative metal-dependent hydrolase [Acidocella aminolytica 101 = DSM 11237]SHF17054.1 hypothetical protein SAMN02746095_02334 [Acidocella aminolytica 101 = DSM 11237]